MHESIDMDIVIFGGGGAGLWLLDELRRASVDAVLLEAFDLGSGQTIASQGIIHGGLKYTLSGLFTPSARAIRDMPLLWRRCLAGEIEPDLSACRLRAQFCHLWRTDSISSRLAMIGARAGLRVKPTAVEREERPAVLANAPGVVARLDEQVIDPPSFLEALASRNRARLMKIDAINGLEIVAESGEVRLIRLINPESGDPVDLRPRHVVFVAGGGNEGLRELVGLRTPAMQRRPLHMVMARGQPQHLPELNGHCVDGTTTRLTITSAMDFTQRRVWQIGGQIAEAGTTMNERSLIAQVNEELHAAIPGLDLSELEWSTYQVDRAEGLAGGSRPEEPRVVRERNVITGWPTKLALVPRLVERIVAESPSRGGVHAGEGGLNAARGRREPMQGLDVLSDWPRPAVAIPPWEIERTWYGDL